MRRLLPLLLLALITPNLLAGPRLDQLPFRFYPLAPQNLDGSLGSLVLGTLRSVEKIPVPAGPRFPPGREYVKITLNVERTLVGPPAPRKTLGWTPVGYEPRGYLASGEIGAPSVGDRVFLIKRATPDVIDWNPDPLACMGFDPGPSLAQATDAEISRIDRAMQILKLQDSPQSTQLAIAGCSDSDPYFAIWCLDLLNPAPREEDEVRQRLYGPISARITAQQYVDLLWKPLGDPASNWRVFIRADELLAMQNLSLADQERRHQLHLQRLDAIFAIPDADFNPQRSEELRRLLCGAYLEMPTELFQSLLQELVRRFPSIQCEHYRSWVARSIYVVDPNPVVYAAVLDYYRQINPLRHPDWNVPVAAYCGGVVDAMRTDSQQTRVTSQDGLEILEQLVLRGSEADATSAAFSLTYYVDDCRRNRIDVSLAESLLQTLRKTAPHQAVREKLGQSLDRWQEEQR